MRPPARVFVNGKFLSAAPTGVHRVAHELITHMDRRLASEGAEAPWTLLHPRDATRPIALQAMDRRQVGVSTWQVWEQFELPAYARGGVLVNLCNLAPLAHSRAVTLIHDAQVFLSPQSYSRPFRAWYRFALPRIGRRAPAVATVSEYSREKLAEYGVAPREKIVVVHNGIDHLGGTAADPEAVRRLGLDGRRFVLATAGAQVHKNLRVLFEAFGGPTLADLTLVVVGGDGREAFEAIGDRPPPGVVFTGRVSDGALRALFEQATALAFPSVTEGFGLPPLEAMSLGCPAVVAPCGALPEVCGEAALYAAPHDPAAWAAPLRRIADDPQTRAALVAAGRAQAARFRWDDAAGKLLGVIRRVAESAPGAAA